MAGYLGTWLFVHVVCGWLAERGMEWTGMMYMD